MADEVTYKSQIYTDVQGLKQLEYSANKAATKKEIAKQFEALMVQMLLHSMRDATKSFSSGLFNDNQMEIYQDMFDKQMSLVMSHSDLGLAKIIENNVDQLSGNREPSITTNTVLAHAPANTSNKPSTAVETQATLPSLDDSEIKKPSTDVSTEQTKQSYFPTQEEFVKKLWSAAKTTAHYIGTTPEILLAQAALETNWGKNIINQKPGESTFNLFNIKADSSWKNKSATVNTIEHQDGVLVKGKSKFRTYESFKESFMDYVHFLKNNTRYDDALNKASDPKQFIKAIHQAGYATDPHYADKVLNIFTSKPFQQLIEKVKNI